VSGLIGVSIHRVNRLARDKLLLELLDGHTVPLVLPPQVDGLAANRQVFGPQVCVAVPVDIVRRKVLRASVGCRFGELEQLEHEALDFADVAIARAGRVQERHALVVQQRAIRGLEDAVGVQVAHDGAARIHDAHTFRLDCITILERSCGELVRVALPAFGFQQLTVVGFDIERGVGLDALDAEDSVLVVVHRMAGDAVWLLHPGSFGLAQVNAGLLHFLLWMVGPVVAHAAGVVHGLGRLGRLERVRVVARDARRPDFEMARLATLPLHRRETVEQLVTHIAGGELDRFRVARLRPTGEFFLVALAAASRLDAAESECIEVLRLDLAAGSRVVAVDAGDARLAVRRLLPLFVLPGHLGLVERLKVGSLLRRCALRQDALGSAGGNRQQEGGRKNDEGDQSTGVHRRSPESLICGIGMPRRFSI
jgi:hypothetical protein